MKEEMLLDGWWRKERCEQTKPSAGKQTYMVHLAAEPTLVQCVLLFSHLKATSRSWGWLDRRKSHWLNSGFVFWQPEFCFGQHIWIAALFCSMLMQSQWGFCAISKQFHRKAFCKRLPNKCCCIFIVAVAHKGRRNNLEFPLLLIINIKKNLLHFSLWYQSKATWQCQVCILYKTPSTAGGEAWLWKVHLLTVLFLQTSLALMPWSCREDAGMTAFTLLLQSGHPQSPSISSVPGFASLHSWMYHPRGGELYSPVPLSIVVLFAVKPEPSYTGRGNGPDNSRRN